MNSPFFLRSVVLISTFAVTSVAQTAVNVTTYHNDLARTAQNTSETKLTTSNVATQFGKVFRQLVDGKVFAQPLFVAGLTINGASHNVLFVATMNNSIYAFDANSNIGTNSSPLWHHTYGTPSAAGLGVNGGTSCGGNLGYINGILGTPVIDTSNNMYFVAASSGIFQVHTINIATGNDNVNPVTISATGFVPQNEIQRAGLAWYNGHLLIAFADFCEQGTSTNNPAAAYSGHGFLFDFTTSPLALAHSLLTTNTTLCAFGGIWHGGGAPSVDTSTGNFFVSTGNTQSKSDVGADCAASPNVENTLGSVNPSNWPTTLTGLQQGKTSGCPPAMYDCDMSTGSPIVLPASAGSSAHPSVLVTGSKDGSLYLVDRNALSINNSTNITVPGTLEVMGGAWFNGAAYYAVGGDYPLKYPISNFAFGTPTSNTAVPLRGSGIPSISAQSPTDTTNAIVWFTQLNNPANGASHAALYALNASSLAKLYESDASTNARDDFGEYVTFSTPTISDGLVYAGNSNVVYAGLNGNNCPQPQPPCYYYGSESVQAYGLLPSLSPLSGAAVVNAKTFTSAGLAPGSLAAIFGSGLATTTATPSTNPRPLTLDGTTVTVNGQAAPLFYISPTQINIQIPFEAIGLLGTPPHTANMEIVVYNGSTVLGYVNANASQVSPVIDALTNASGSNNTPSTPCVRPSCTYVTAWGIGQSYLYSLPTSGIPQPVQTNALAPSFSPLAQTTFACSAKISTFSETPLFCGGAPGSYAGLQANIPVPSTSQLGAGTYTLTLTLTIPTTPPTPVSATYNVTLQ
jgi:uncharacterized protein (TIGR03437 family)